MLAILARELNLLEIGTGYIAAEHKLLFSTIVARQQTRKPLLECIFQPLPCNSSGGVKGLQLTPLPLVLVSLARHTYDRAVTAGVSRNAESELFA